MGKYLTNFKTKEEYNSFKDSSNYIYPNISYIEDSGSVINKSPQIQEKQIEITENGEITITPDAGFAYLNSVKVKTNVAQSGGSGGIPNYEIDGDTSPLYCLIEGELAEKIYNGDALKASEAESFFEKMNNAWLTLIKFPDSPLLLVYNLVGFDTDLTFFSIGNSGIDTSGELWGSIITFTKNGSVYELSTNYYPAE